VPAILRQRLELVFDWYRGMIDERTGRLAYTYDPEDDAAIADGSPIRDIASVWDVELLSRFLGRQELLPLAERSLGHYTAWLVDHDGTLILDATRLGEPSSIAHSAFLILSLLASNLPGRAARVIALAEGILRQQRADGSYRIHFAGEPDQGLEFYPGEAMLALMETYGVTRDARLLASVERGFQHHRDRMPPAAVDPELLVFYANWQSQYASLLHERAPSASVCEYVFGLHDRLLGARFFDDIEREPNRQATVEVACALEGMNDAYAMALRVRDAERARAYERGIRAAVTWLLGAQRLERCTPRERGGFGHSLRDRTQRIDVTGHVVGGFIKTARNRVGT
jgi:hypothetical protein